MGKSNFDAIITMKQQEKQREAENTELAPITLSPVNLNTQVQKKAAPVTLRRTYRVEAAHDKAIKAISKLMTGETEEEIVLNIFRFYFANDQTGQKALKTIAAMEDQSDQT